jgi:hypothetical protein
VPPSERRLLLERARARESGASTLIDMGAQLMIYKRDEKLEAEIDADIAAGREPKRTHAAVPDFALPKVYGGMYDPQLKCYRGPPKRIHQLSCNPIQQQVIEALEERVLLLGAMGSGKTESCVLMALLGCLTYPGCPGGVVAPVSGKKSVAWDKFIDLLRPLGWIKDIRPARVGRPAEIQVVNDAVAQFVSAKRQSMKTGSPISAFGWYWAVEEEQQNIDDASLTEVKGRGRVNAGRFRIHSSATNYQLHEFQLRLQEYDRNPKKRVIRCSGYENVFVLKSHWESMRGETSLEEFERLILCKDVPITGRVYPMFDYKRHLQPLPKSQDITRAITSRARVGSYDIVVGCDPGRLVTYAVALRAFAGPNGRPIWYAVKEFYVVDQTMDFLGRKLLDSYKADSFVVHPDPHKNEKETSESDFATLRALGINVMRAHWGKIGRKHRFSMFNGLLLNGRNETRFYIATDEYGRPTCPKLAESLGHLMYAANGEPENAGKTIKDLTHPTDGCGYGLYKYESDVGLIVSGGRAN